LPRERRYNRPLEVHNFVVGRSGKLFMQTAPNSRDACCRTVWPSCDLECRGRLGAGLWRLGADGPKYYARTDTRRHQAIRPDVYVTRPEQRPSTPLPVTTIELRHRPGREQTGKEFGRPAIQPISPPTSILREQRRQLAPGEAVSVESFL